MTRRDANDAREQPSGSAGVAWLKQHGPTLLVGVLVVAAYADLRSRLPDEPSEPPAPAARAETPTRAGPDAATTRRGKPPRRPAPAEGPAAWNCAGAIPGAMLRRSLGRHGRAVFDCYAEARARAPQLRGSLTVQARVDASGRVTDSRLYGTATDPGLHQCVSDSVSSWAFPRPRGGDCAVVEAPFVLTPDAGVPE